MSAKILIVDDEPRVRGFLVDFLLDEGYQVEEAKGGQDALQKLAENNDFELILADMMMPGMTGYELLYEVEKKYPHIKRVLITAYSIQEYIPIIIKFSISNIITKTSPFNLGEISTILKNLIEEKIFGIHRFLAPGVNIKTFSILSPQELNRYILIPVEDMNIVNSKQNVCLVMKELINNAIYYGIKDMDPEHKELWTHDFSLQEGEVEISYGMDDEKYGIAIIDNGGKLTKTKVLHWLERQVKKDENDLPIGLFDTHGRGLYISREYVDRLIINIKRNERTEIICLNYTTSHYRGNKSLLINEI